MNNFISGLELSRYFFEESVRPILKKHFPKLKYSAALIGYGSEVLGFDTPLSRDHAWGPRLLLFVREKDYSRRKHMSRIFSQELPYTFRGYSTNFGKPDKFGVRHMVSIKSGPINHKVDIFTLKSFLELRLCIDQKQKLSSLDWLSMPQQRLLEITSGAIFYDGLGELTKIRKKLNYFPRDVWLYLLASQWQKLSQEEAFVGRTGAIGDELGSQLVAARLVRELMRLCFLIERKYFPYSKWFGSAFQKLECSKKLSPILRKVFLAKLWKERERYLGRAYSIVAQMHNALHIAKALPTKVSKYHARPFHVIHADAFADAIKGKIKNAQLKKLELVGSVDQFTNVSSNTELCKWLKTAYIQKR